MLIDIHFELGGREDGPGVHVLHVERLMTVWGGHGDSQKILAKFTFIYDRKVAENMIDPIMIGLPYG